MEEFLKKSKELNKRIDNLENFLTKLKYQTNLKRNSIMTENEESQVNNKIKAINDLFKTEVDDIKNELNEILKKSETEFEKETRISHYKSLSEKLTNIINKYRYIQLDYNRNERNRFKSMYRIARPDATEEELENANNEEILKSKFAMGSKSSKRLLKQAENKNKNIKEIVKNIEELNNLMEQLKEMVQNTGDVVDKIEINMEKAEEDTKKANQDLDQALEYQRSYMWYKRLFYIFISVIIGIFIIWVILQFRK